MADFITLVCESCGGKLHLTEQVNRFVCPYCGHEHLVKPSTDSMVSSCACPVCGKDDQVQKLSSIVSAGTSSKTGIYKIFISNIDFCGKLYMNKETDKIYVRLKETVQTCKLFILLPQL